jgi:hypothetical protein
MSRVALSRHCQRFAEDLEQLRAWYKIRDTLFGENQGVKKAFELASVCEHPNAVWLKKLFPGRELASVEKARQGCLRSENEPSSLLC